MLSGTITCFSTWQWPKNTPCSRLWDYLTKNQSDASPCLHNHRTERMYSLHLITAPSCRLHLTPELNLFVVRPQTLSGKFTNNGLWPLIALWINYTSLTTIIFTISRFYSQRCTNDIATLCTVWPWLNPSGIFCKGLSNIYMTWQGKGTLKSKTLVTIAMFSTYIVL